MGGDGRRFLPVTSGSRSPRGMPCVLVLGAGQSAPYLIARLLEQGHARGFEVVVADVNRALAEQRVNRHPAGRAVGLDATDLVETGARIRDADVVVNLLAPGLQPAVAARCVELGRHMVSASYRSDRVASLDVEARARGVTVLCELGLDPGLDHLSAMKMLDAARRHGRRIVRFVSYGSGVLAPGSGGNPFGYVITWNPRNVVMAGEAGAQFVDVGSLRMIPYPDVFARTWSVEVPELGLMEAYANRDSLVYRDLYGLQDADTLIRATLRFPGFCEAWHAIARLGLPNENLVIPDLSRRSWAEVVETCLPAGTGRDLRRRVADHLRIHRTGHAMNAMAWLGLFSGDRIGGDARTPAQALANLLQEKLQICDDQQDVVIIRHELEAEAADGRREQTTSTLIEYGRGGRMTAMARTVGLPAALAAEMLLLGEPLPRGVVVPTVASIYEPLLVRLADAGLVFSETSMLLNRRCSATYGQNAASADRDAG